ncbi:hypothetical protein HDR63_03045 [bacterium]|nr:hypothetical protein [bacterium]
MIIMAFAPHTSKILPRLVCRRLRHCAVILPGAGDDLTLYQFVRRNRVIRIPLRRRDIRILRAHGWRMVYVSPGRTPDPAEFARAWTCVDMARRALDLHAWWIQTPLALYKHLTRPPR